MDTNSLRVREEETRALCDLAYDKIKEAIVNGIFSPGERISERKLAEKMGISTSPIKHALNRLQYEGFTEIKPRKGTYVSALCQPNAVEIIFIQANLGGLMARFSTQNITEEEIRDLRKLLLQMNKLTMQGDFARLITLNKRFHHKIYIFSRSRYTYQLFGTVQTFEDNWEEFALDIREAKRRMTEHQGIFEALANHNGELAEERMKNHILKLGRRWWRRTSGISEKLIP